MTDSASENIHYSLFTPAHFIESVLPDLRSIPIPDSCILSLIPGTEASVQIPVKKQIRFINQSRILVFDEPVAHIFVFGGVGAPAAVMALEILIDLGIRKIILLGTCGILKQDICSGEIIIPTSFIREEGTSSHYLDPQLPLQPDEMMIKNVTAAFENVGMNIHQGIHWTTDAPFRESPEKISEYRQKGCLSVDMEMSALFAAAQVHHLNPAAALIGSDLLRDTGWSPPSPSASVVRKQIRRCLRLFPEFFSQAWPFENGFTG